MGSTSTMARILGYLLCIVSTLANIPGSSLQKPTSYNLTIKPEHYLFVNPASEVNVLCTLHDAAGNTVPLSGCGFSVYRTAIAWEFNYGPGSPPMELDGVRGRYHGRGLEHGECGLTFGEYKTYKPHIMGCRVRPSSGKEWQSEDMMLDATVLLPMDFHIQPSGVSLALPGSNITLIGKSKLQLVTCSFTYHDLTHWPKLATGTHFYLDNATQVCNFENKPNKTECDVTLDDLQPEMSGFFVMMCRHDTKHWSHDYVELIVATAPTEMGMTNETMIIERGEVLLSIACWAKNSRPVANITWLLDNEVIRQDSTNDGPAESEWLWNHDPHSIVQYQSIRAFPKYNGKTLVCRIGHVALPLGTMDFRRVLDVDHPPIFELPSPETGVLIRAVGEECTLVVKATANPPGINYTWTFGSDDKVIPSEGPVLNLKDLAVEDSGWYTCTAVNSVGSAFSTFQLTVMECHGTQYKSHLITAGVTCLLLVALFGGLVALLKFYKCFHWSGRPRLESQEMEPVLEAENTDSYWH